LFCIVQLYTRMPVEVLRQSIVQIEEAHDHSRLRAEA
jgi:hypothetical protein